MKRLEFLKRLGLGALAAASAPALLKDENFEYVKREEFSAWRNDAVKSHSSGLTFEVNNWDYKPISFDNAKITMQIKGHNSDIYLCDSNGLKVTGNTIEVDYKLCHGEYDYELIMDDDMLSKGKIKI